ncbi:MerR family transcriptional regulator [Actinospica sp.]|uniref:MerR family transcriptional regulator n=1 Tax=Actinospica sp. TaxID=1872142 RepID=UPI002BC46819|nr:MerR family transcriptional regulator [Actinospica sp.]HWG25052.1 MerR family transcriptional regulator [Actinospica sp.]
MDEAGERLGIGEVARRTGLSVHALRFYERQGLLPGPVFRDHSGRRVYTEQDADWLILCVVLRGSAMPLPVVRRYTELVRDGDGNERERLELLRGHREAVLAQMAQLQQSIDLIDFKVAVYEDLLDGGDSGLPGENGKYAVAQPAPRGGIRVRSPRPSDRCRR